MARRSYIGERDNDGVARVYVVHEDGKKEMLKPRLDIVNHSPTGLEWGYGGSGPGQLAVAILADATGDDEVALRHHQAFKWNEIAFFEREESWAIKQESVLVWVSQQQRLHA
jgi:hypothetical protein